MNEFLVEVTHRIFCKNFLQIDARTDNPGKSIGGHRWTTNGHRRGEIS